MFARLAGVQLEHVPYKGNAESVRALLANEVQVYFASVSAGLEQVAGGIKGIHVLTTAWPSRLPGYPDAPSAAESGVPGLNVSNGGAWVRHPERRSPFARNWRRRWPGA